MLSSDRFHKFFTNARRLVPFLPPKPISTGTAKKQDGSLLLSRLPPEVLGMIWETYFRGHAVHVYPERDKKVRSRECFELDTALPGPHFRVCGRNGKGGGSPTRCNHISLLLACKKIYFECIYTLYRETLFDFSHGPLSLVLIPERLPATHIALISRVNLKWELYHVLWLKMKKLGKREIMWLGVWKALAAMEGLEWLRVELVIVNPYEASIWTAQEWTFWEAIEKVTSPSHFELILPFPAATSTREETLPCTITRVVDPRSLEF